MNYQGEFVGESSKRKITDSDHLLLGVAMDIVKFLNPVKDDPLLKAAKAYLLKIFARFEEKP